MGSDKLKALQMGNSTGSPAQAAPVLLVRLASIRHPSTLDPIIFTKGLIGAFAAAPKHYCYLSHISGAIKEISQHFRTSCVAAHNG